MPGISSSVHFAHIACYRITSLSYNRFSLYRRRKDHTENTNHLISISPVHWRAVCCLATSYNIRPIVASAYGGVFIEPLRSNTLSKSVKILSFRLFIDLPSGLHPSGPTNTPMFYSWSPISKAVWISLDDLYKSQRPLLCSLPNSHLIHLISK
jgi:hypothetical protein